MAMKDTLVMLYETGASSVMVTGDNRGVYILGKLNLAIFVTFASLCT